MNIGSVPDVRDLEARHQFESFGPIRPGVAGDGGFGVALRALLHVAGLGRAAAVQAGAITPLGIELDAVRRVGHQQLRLAILQEPRHIAPALVELPHSTRCLPQSHRSPRREAGIRWKGGAAFASSSSGSASRPSISFGSKPVRLRSKSAALSSCKLDREQFLIPRGPRDGAIHHQAECLHLGLRPLVAEDHRNFGDAQLACGFQPQVAVHDLAVAACQHGDLEAELANAAAHAIHRGVVLAGIACVEDQLVDRPSLDFSGEAAM